MKINELTQECQKVSDTKIEQLNNLVNSYNEIIIIGNGGSSAIASHISQDYTKKLKKKSFTFSDSSRLTCYINDYGMEKAYTKFLEEFSSEDSLVILISSSGESKNILNCADYCKINNIAFVTLTGFNEFNALREKYSSFSKLDFWVNSKDYGVVECIHQIFLHTPA